MGEVDGNERCACLLDQLTEVPSSISPPRLDNKGLLYVASEVDMLKPQV